MARCARYHQRPVLLFNVKQTPPAEAAAPAAVPRWRRLLSGELLIIVVLLVGLQFWQSREMAGGTMPPIEGTLADGRGASLATIRDKARGAVLVYVWSAWCPVCRLEEGMVTAVAQDWPVLTVAMQSGDAPEVKTFMAQRGLTYPTLVDERGEIAWQLGVRGVPAWFVVDSRDRIRFTGAGYTTAWGLRLRLWWAATWA